MRAEQDGYVLQNDVYILSGNQSKRMSKASNIYISITGLRCGG